MTEFNYAEHEEEQAALKAKLLADVEISHIKEARRFEEWHKHSYGGKFMLRRVEWDITLRHIPSQREYRMERYETGDHMSIGGKRTYESLTWPTRGKILRTEKIEVKGPLGCLFMDAATVDYGQTLDDLASEFELLPTKAMELFAACHRTRIGLLIMLGAELYQLGLKIEW